MDDRNDPELPAERGLGHFHYVQVEVDGCLVDAQIIARKNGNVLVVYPQPADHPLLDSRMQSRWIDEGRTVRIRREDASWNNNNDDIDWHETQDGY